MILSREQIEACQNWHSFDPAKTIDLLAETALHYEARCGELMESLASENKLVNERTRERDELQKWTDRVAETSTDAATAADEAEAENMRLREALRAIASIPENAAHYNMCSKRARKALAPTGDPKEESRQA